jgi:hypothetical protein
MRLAACKSPLGSPAEMKNRMGDNSLPCLTIAVETIRRAGQRSR